MGIKMKEPKNPARCRSLALTLLQYCFSFGNSVAVLWHSATATHLSVASDGNITNRNRSTSNDSNSCSNNMRPKGKTLLTNSASKNREHVICPFARNGGTLC